MSYVVLARKWRPQSFESLTGQGHVARTLQNAILTGRIPHAMLLTGPRGVGKTSSARIISMALNCVHGPTPQPCGTCRACEEIRAGRAVDILEIDGASNRGINEIRELRDSVQYAPSKDRYKVYIIDEVHMLTTEAFNALLKTLEEPPPHVVFIFATTEPQKIPVTILSRCQRFDFRQIALPDMIERLELILQEEGIDAEPEALHLVARQAAGGMRDALSLLDQVISASDGKITTERTAELLGTADRRMLFALSEAVFKRSSAESIQTLSAVLRRGTDVSWFANEFATHMRDLMVLKVAGTRDKLAVFSDEELRIATAQLAQVDITTLEALLDLMISAAEEISRSSLGTLRFELTLIRMCEIETRQSLEYIIALLEKHAGIDRPLPPAPTRASSAPFEEQVTRPKSEGLTHHVSPPSQPLHVESSSRVETAAGASAALTPFEARLETLGPESQSQSSLNTSEHDDDTLEPQPGLSAQRVSGEALAPLPQSEPAVAMHEAQDPPVSPEFEHPAETLSLVVEEPDSTLIAPDEGSEDEPSAGDELEAPVRESSTVSSDDVLDGEMTFARWRRIVELLTREAHVFRFLASGYASALDGKVQVALTELVAASHLDDLEERFKHYSEQLCGRSWAIEIIPQSKLSEAQLQSAWRIRTEEEEEQEIRRQQIFTQIVEHPVVKAIQTRWPEIQITAANIEFDLNESTDEVPE